MKRQFGHPTGVSPGAQFSDRMSVAPALDLGVSLRSHIAEDIGVMMTRPPTDVACLVLRDAQGYIFVAQRGEGMSLEFHWEFPGGKFEKGESGEDALRRELREELELVVGVLQPLPEVAHNYPFMSIRLHPFLATCEERPEVILHEHADSAWFTVEKSTALLWAPADLPVLEMLRMQVDE